MNASERAALAEQYANADNLNARVRLHEEHDTADRDWWRWVFDRVDLPDGTRVLELEPLVAYAGSLSAIEREELAAFTDRAAERLEASDGPLGMEKSMGLFVAWAP